MSSDNNRVVTIPPPRPRLFVGILVDCKILELLVVEILCCASTIDQHGSAVVGASCFLLVGKRLEMWVGGWVGRGVREGERGMRLVSLITLLENDYR